MSTEQTGRAFVVPDDPALRLRKTRHAVRVILVDDADRTFLFEDTDPGIAGTSWWVTPGGGMDPGETEAQTAVREVAEETGYRLGEDELVGPVARRSVVHGYSDQIIEQHESFFVARVRDFALDISGHTEEERITLQRSRWWSREELAVGAVEVWPAQLLQVWALAGDPAQWPLELGTQEESTVPVEG